AVVVEERDLVVLLARSRDVLDGDLRLGRVVRGDDEVVRRVARIRELLRVRRGHERELVPRDLGDERRRVRGAPAHDGRASVGDLRVDLLRLGDVVGVVLRAQADPVAFYAAPAVLPVDV